METLMKWRNQGGMGLVDLHAKQHAIKIKWIFTIQKDIFLEESLYATLSPQLTETIWNCNLHVSDVSKIFDASMWRGMLESWCTLNYHSPLTRQEILKQVIWYNSNLQVDRKLFLFTKWYELGIVTIEHLLDNNGELYSLARFRDKYSLSWLDYVCITKCLPDHWKELLKSGSQIDNQEIEYVHTSLQKYPAKNLTRIVYNYLIFDSSVIRKYWDRWRVEGIQFVYEKYEVAFSKLCQITKITKLRDFQYHLLLKKNTVQHGATQMGFSS